MSGNGVAKMGGEEKWTYSLRPPRPPASRPGLITKVLYLNLVGRLLWLAFAYQQGEDPLYTFETLSMLMVEMVLSTIFVEIWCRWEDQGHFITFWQVLTSLMAFSVRRSVYHFPLLFTLLTVLLYVAFIVGLMADWRQVTPIRLPPFAPKSVDSEKPKHGWLGLWLWLACRRKITRLPITILVYVFSLTRTFMMTYFYFVTIETGLDKSTEDLLFLISIIFAIIGLLPVTLVTLVCQPEMFRDNWNMKKAVNGYSTGPFEVALLKEDIKEGGGTDFSFLNGHQCGSMTVVIPCYMPNEEEIIFPIIEYYKKIAEEYPGELRVLVVWNSPQEHPETENQLAEVAAKWPRLKVHRCFVSTSKCDNLNEGMDHLETDMACLNDADTMISSATLARASVHICGQEGLDLCQSHSSHCFEDKVGMPESGCFCFGPLVTLLDSTKPLNMSTQGWFKHSPFNGRGGVWRVSALKKIGFDHRIIGEDHDAAYRGFAAYGFKGIIDANMLCQEREPPDCGSLVSQRIRWETAALEMRRTFPWVLRSTHYSKFECFILIWSQLCWNTNMPFQMMPFQMYQVMPIAAVKTYIWTRLMFPDTATMQKMCEGEDCVYEYESTSAGKLVQIALPIAFVIFIAIFVVYLSLMVVDFVGRACATRYRPRIVWLVYSIFVVPFVMMPFLNYCQFWAFNDYCWGGAKFICTARSPSSGGASPRGDDIAVEGDKEPNNDTSEMPAGAWGKADALGRPLLQGRNGP